MDMALDDVIMQERAAKRNERKKWRQQRPRNLAAAASVPNSQATSSIKGHRTAAATAAATTSTVLTSGPQRTRAKARERRRERAKPYAVKIVQTYNSSVSRPSDRCCCHCSTLLMLRADTDDLAISTHRGLHHLPRLPAQHVHHFS
jgi:hypothetical protein